MYCLVMNVNRKWLGGAPLVLLKTFSEYYGMATGYWVVGNVIARRLRLTTENNSAVRVVRGMGLFEGVDAI